MNQLFLFVVWFVTLVFVVRFMERKVKFRSWWERQFIELAVAVVLYAAMRAAL